MTQIRKLSNREWEVVKLLLQGKSNKLIASSFHISVRTVEFHLKNVYAKYQVNSRIELILILVNTTGKIDIDKLGHSTVDNREKTAENTDISNSQTNWAKSVISERNKIMNMNKDREERTVIRKYGNGNKGLSWSVGGMIGGLVVGMNLATIYGWTLLSASFWLGFGLMVGALSGIVSYMLSQLIHGLIFNRN